MIKERWEAGRRVTRALALAALVLLAGCATGGGTPPGPTEARTDTPTRTPAPTESPTPTATPAPDNPWAQDTVTVAVDQPAGRDYGQLVREAVEYWDDGRVSRHGAYEVDLVYAGESDGTEDVTVEVTPIVSTCGMGDFLGCAPVVDEDGSREHALVEVSSSQNDVAFLNTAKHELGHVLGIEHGGGPTWLMAHGDGTGYAPDALDRERPLNSTGPVRVAVADGAGPGVEAAVREVVAAYDGDPSLAPGGVVVVDGWREADVVVQTGTPEGWVPPASPGSYRYLYGLDWDSDDAFERVEFARIQLYMVEDHERGVGYWLGVLMGNDPSELPEEYR